MKRDVADDERATEDTAGDATDPDLRSPGGEGTTVGTELGAQSGTTTGLGGTGNATAGGGLGPDLAGGTAPPIERPAATDEAERRRQPPDHLPR
jgi:hypothetical protein